MGSSSDPDSDVDGDDLGDDGYDQLYSDSDADDNDVPKWYENLPSFGTCTILPKSEIEALRFEAEKVLEHQPKADQKKSWITEIAKQGTYSDKIAALTIKIQEDPLHNVGALQNLVGMVKIGKKQQCSLVIDSLTELFTRVLLRTELLTFENQPLSELSKLDDLKQRKLLLSSWLFEEKLKNLYSSFVEALSTVGLDSIPVNREKSISALYKLLLNSTECEMQIIRYIVNKFGDTVHKVASKAMYTMRLILKHRPNLDQAIFEEVRKLLFRSNIKQRAQYYGICFLTQIDTKVIAKEVIELYLSFFKACVKTGAIDSRLIGALLVGVNKSYPHVKSGIQPEQIQTMYKIVHLAPFNISLQALLLIRQLENNDRYYCALYKKISDERLITTSHQAICIHLIYKSIWDDNCTERMISFMKRILQMCLYCPVPMVSGIFCMISRLMKKHKGIIGKSRFEEIKTEIISKPPIILSNTLKDEVEEEEKYFDVQSNVTDSTETPQKSSWYHLKAPQVVIEPEIPQAPKEREVKNYYDYTARNPKYAGGEHAILGELIPLSRHYHPTVATFASRIITGKSIYYDGNPLADFTLLHFLDRFSFKNPKKPREGQGQENDELFRSVGTSKKHYVPKGLKSMSVVSEEYLSHEEKQIPLDEVFLYKYLKQRPKSKKSKKADENSDEDGFSDVDSVNSDDFNELLDGMMGAKKKKKYDFSRGFEKKSKSKKAKNHVEESESEDDNDDEFIIPRKSKNLADLAVPAEKFAAMLDAAGKKKSGGRDDILVRDNASTKQLDWEKKKSGGKRKRLEDGRKNRKRHRIQKR